MKYKSNQIGNIQIDVIKPPSYAVNAQLNAVMAMLHAAIVDSISAIYRPQQSTRIELFTSS